MTHQIISYEKRIHSTNAAADEAVALAGGTLVCLQRRSAVIRSVPLWCFGLYRVPCSWGCKLAVIFNDEDPWFDNIYGLKDVDIIAVNVD